MAKVKSKTSSVKQRNRLRNKGKIKTKKHHSKTSLLNQIHNKKPEPAPLPEDDPITDDVIDMIDKEDIEYLKSSISHKKYGLLSRIHIES